MILHRKNINDFQIGCERKEPGNEQVSVNSRSSLGEMFNNETLRSCISLEINFHIAF